MSENHWITGAIKHHGAFRKKAQAAKMTTEAYAKKHEHADGVLGHQARLALTLMHLHHHDKGEAASKPPEEGSMADFKSDVAGAVGRRGKS